MTNSQIAMMLAVAGATAGVMTLILPTTHTGTMAGAFVAVALCCISIGMVIASSNADEESKSSTESKGAPPAA